MSSENVMHVQGSVSLLLVRCRTGKVGKIHDVALLPHVRVHDAPERLDERLYVRLLLHELRVHRIVVIPKWGVSIVRTRNQYHALRDSVELAAVDKPSELVFECELRFELAQHDLLRLAPLINEESVQ